MKYILLVILYTFLTAQDVTLSISDYEDQLGYLQVHFESPVEDIYGFQFRIIYEPGEYCEKTDITDQQECIDSGFEWFYLDGLTGDDFELITFGNLDGGLAQEVGFLVTGNESGDVLGFSLLGTPIPAGSGGLTNIYWNANEFNFSGEVSLTIVNIAGTGGEQLEFNVGAPLCYNCIEGCTDPFAINYDPFADIDDGSCEYGFSGDVNQDLTLNVQDLIMMVNFVIGVSNPDDYEFWASDVNEDLVIDVLDIVWVVNCIMNSCWESPECIDIDGNTYETVQIGDQLWMAENLKASRYNNGDSIPTGFSNTEWLSLFGTATGAFAVYNDDPLNADIYGFLYNWFALDDARGICPEGFHIPSDEEWMELEMTLGMSYEEAHLDGHRGTNQGCQLAGNSNLWPFDALVNDPEFGTSGFNALPGGYRLQGDYHGIGAYSQFWSYTTNTVISAWSRRLHYTLPGVSRWPSNTVTGSAVRCLRDETP